MQNNWLWTWIGSITLAGRATACVIWTAAQRPGTFAQPQNRQQQEVGDWGKSERRAIPDF